MHTTTNVNFSSILFVDAKGNGECGWDCADWSTENSEEEWPCLFPVAKVCNLAFYWIVLRMIP